MPRNLTPTYLAPVQPVSASPAAEALEPMQLGLIRTLCLLKYSYTASKTASVSIAGELATTYSPVQPGHISGEQYHLSTTFLLLLVSPISRSLFHFSCQKAKCEPPPLLTLGLSVALLT